jgi:hypothetical protein
VKISDQDLKSAFDHEHDARRLANSSIQAFQRQEPPQTLYHYTSAPGIQGIIERGAIWCTNAEFFNDASELGYGLTQLDKALKTIKIDPVFADMVKEIYPAIRENLDVYAACFCERGDLLNQWHSYGERGGGFSLGLSTSGLASIISGSNLVLVKVQYDPQVQIDLLQAQISTASDALDHLVLSYEIDLNQLRELQRQSLLAVLSSLSIVVAAMKDPVFRGEEEWRLIQYRSKVLEPLQDIAFRVSGQLLTPYIPTRICLKDTNVLPIREVIVGPTVNRLAERSVKSLLRRYGMWKIKDREVKLTRSEIPLQSVN